MPAPEDLFHVKTVLGSTDLTLEADPGEAFLVYDILIDTPTSNYITVSIDKATIGYFRCRSDGRGSHVHFPLTDKEKKSLVGQLISGGLWRPYPIPSGSKLKITGAAGASAVQSVVYRKMQPGTVRLDQPNGPHAKDYDIILYGQPSSAPGDGTTELATANNPAVFPRFPFTDDVPPGTKITIWGILFSDVAKESGTGANKQATTYLKLTKGRTTLFDEDLNGIPYRGALPGSDTTVYGTGVSAAGDYSSVDQRWPLMFPEPLVFTEGEDLDIHVTTSVSAGSANLTAADVEVGLICRVQES